MFLFESNVYDTYTTVHRVQGMKSLCASHSATTRQVVLDWRAEFQLTADKLEAFRSTHLLFLAVTRGIRKLL